MGTIMTDYEIEFTFKTIVKVKNTDREDVAIQKATDKIHKSFRYQDIKLVYIKVASTSINDEKNK